MGRVAVRRACAALVLLVAVGPGAVRPAGADPATVGAALAAGDPAAARRIAAAEVAGQPDAALGLAHLEGLIALQAGDAAAAAAIFRTILSVAPGYEPSRLMVVVALDRLGRRDEARRVAGAGGPRVAAPGRGAAPATAVPPAVPATVPRSGVALRFAVLPSSNLTGGTRARTVDLGGLPFVLDPGSRAEGGVGLTLGATVWRRWALDARWSAVLSGSADLRMYGDVPRPDEADVGLRLDLARGFGRGGVSFGPRVALAFREGHLRRRQAGVGVSADALVAPRLRLSGEVEVLAQDHPDASFRDGTRVSARLGLDWAASPQTVLSLEIPVLRETARARHLAHTDAGLGIGVRHSFPAGLALGVHLFAGEDRYDGVYPGFGTARTDRVQSLRVTVSDRRLRLFGLIPEISVTRRRQDSTIPLHDVWSTDVGLSFVQRF